MSAELQGIGAYRLVELVAEGSRSAVYRATRDGEEGLAVVGTEVVGLEVLDKAQLADAAERTAFVERRRAALGLDGEHDDVGDGIGRHIVVVREVADADGRPYAVTDAVDGLPLAGLYPKRGKLKLPIPAAATLLHDVMTALAVARSSSAALVHGRLAPDVVWVTTDGTVRVSGFGAQDTGVADFRALVAIAQTLTVPWPAEVDGWFDELQRDDPPFRDIREALAGFPLSASDDGRKALSRLLKRTRKRQGREAAVAQRPDDDAKPAARTRKRVAQTPRAPIRPGTASGPRSTRSARPGEDVAAATRQARIVVWLCGGLLIAGLLVELFAGSGGA